MKLLLLALGFALALPAFQRAPERTAAIDDPPPEPVDCPLCGGDPQLHVSRTFAIVNGAGDLAARVLSW